MKHNAMALNASQQGALPLPRSVVVAQWVPLALRNDVSASMFESIVTSCDEPHEVLGLEALRFEHRVGLEPAPHLDVSEPATLAALIDALASFHEPEVYAVLPRPGFITGLTGPAHVNTAAIDAHECVVIAESGRTVALLVPSVQTFGTIGDQGHHVTWRVLPCNPRPVALRNSIRAVHHSLQSTLLEHLAALESLDLPAVVRGDTSLAEYIEIDHPSQWVVARLPELSENHRELVGLALRLILVTQHALDAQREAPSVTAVATQDLALLRIHHAATDALLASLRAV